MLRPLVAPALDGVVFAGARFAVAGWVEAVVLLAALRGVLFFFVFVLPAATLAEAPLRAVAPVLAGRLFVVALPVADFPAAALRAGVFPAVDLRAGVFPEAFCLEAALRGAAFPVALVRVVALLADVFLADVFLAGVFLADVFPDAAFADDGLRVAALALPADALEAVREDVRAAAGFFAAFAPLAFLAVDFVLAGFFTAGLPGPAAVFRGAPFFAATVVFPDFASPERVADLVLRALLGVLRVDFAMFPHRCRSAAGCYSLVDRCQQHLSHPDSRSGVNRKPTLTRIILLILAFYKRLVSPLLGQRCRFHPSCSEYARIAVARFGPWRGSLLAAWRILRCQPLCTGGPDPVPEDFVFTSCRTREEAPPHD